MVTTRQQPGMACEECRRRKARCDRVRPQCGICVEAGRNCIVIDKRPQRGPKKGQLKDLRSRVALLEQRLVDQHKAFEPDSTNSDETTPERDPIDELDSYASTEMGFDNDSLHMLGFPASQPQTPGLSKGWQGFVSSCTLPATVPLAPITPVSSIDRRISLGDGGGWEMTDLMQADLDLLYFERVHPIVPMIHKRRYFAWARDEHPSPARACLRSAMRTVAAAMSAPFRTVDDALYTSTRRMLETQEVHGETGLPWTTRVTPGGHEPIDHERIQAWLLLAHYEFLRKSEQQALLTAGRAFRLLQLARLWNLDGPDERDRPLSSSSSSGSASVSPSLLTGLDEAWIETEEKRRTMWTAFVLDRLSSMLNDRPVMLHEEIICTRLPMSEADFQNGVQPVSMGFLPETMGHNGACGTLPSFAECVILANLFGRCIAHRRLAQSLTPLAGTESETQDFWTRHEWLAAAAAAATRTRLHSSTTPETGSAGAGVPAKCDPMLSFNRILAYSATVSLSCTAEANPWQTLGDHLTALTYKQLAYQAASEVVLLIRTAPRMVFFKMHPFLPNALSVVAGFLNAARPDLGSPGEDRLDGVNHLLGALRYLSDVNNLARDLLYRHEADLTRPSIDVATNWV